MKSIESSGKTMEEAVTQGLEKLGASLGDVTIDIINEGSKGLFGLLGGKPARVRLTVKNGSEDSDLLSSLSIQCDIQDDDAVDAKKRQQTPKAKKFAAEKTEPNAKPARAERGAAEKTAKPAPKTETRTTVKAAPSETPQIQDPATSAGKAQQFLMDVTRLMSVDVTVSAGTDEDGNVRVDMHGDTLGILIGRRGETLDALQYLTSLNVNRGQEEYTRVTIDTENYRAKREEALTRLANRMANRAVKTGRKVVLEPMNPYERRILHSALQQNDAVTTHSEGDEPNRHVVITLK